MVSPRGWPAVACVVAVPAGVGADEALQFIEVSASAGILAEFPVFLPGETRFPHMLGGGTVGDFNADGWQDVFLLLGGFEPDRLYVNNADGTFTDRAAEWGIDAVHVGSGASVGDYNADGWPDLYVTSHGLVGAPAPGVHRLYRNNADGTFTDVADEAGVRFASPHLADGFGSAFGDYDLDGDLDLAVSGWDRQSDGNRLFRNNADGTFTDVTPDAFEPADVVFRAFGMRFADLTGDRFPDMVWPGDGGTTRYFVNATDGTFLNMKQSAGFTVDTNAMGITLGDFDLDQDLDVYITNVYHEVYTPFVFSGNTLYRNAGDGLSFAEIGSEAGVQAGWWGWGVSSGDLDLDGDEDIIATNGWTDFPYLDDPTVVFRNDGVVGGVPQFTEVAEQVGMTHNGQGRALSLFDYDNDGDLDVLICANPGPVTLWRNDTSPGRHWIRVFLDTSRTPWNAPNGMGAVVKARYAGKSRLRVIEGGVNYLGQNELSAHFGLGAADLVDSIEVTWPDGRVTLLESVPADQTITIEAPCPADMNDDGVLDILDFIEIQALFSREDPLADIDASGDLTILDFIAFQGLFNTGCG